ncbi:MAG: FtsW/RodA/SpoVE family cell cycle protein [Sphingomonadales bacterium]
MLIERTDQSLIDSWWWTVDKITLGSILLLIGMGLFVISSASLPEAARNGVEPFYYFKRHLMFASVWLMLMLILSIIPAVHLGNGALWGFGVSLVLVFATFAMGSTLNGARRWLSIGGLSLQPSELLKPFFVVVTALILAQRFSRPTMRVLQLSLIVLMAVIVPLALQPDVSQALMLSLVWMAQILLAGYSLWFFLALAVSAMAGLASAYLAYPHVAARIESFLTPSFDPYSQVGISIRAFMNGGLFGRGMNEGALKSSLADRYADFVFAAVGEELGFFISALLVVLFAAILLRGMARMLHEDHAFNFLAASGLLILFGLQTLLNLMVTLGMAPPTGVTLPFVSYGGSALLGMAIVMGFVLAFTRRIHFSTGLRVYRRRSTP